MDRKLKLVITIIGLLVFILLLWLAENYIDAFIKRILNVAAIYVILGVSLNLINGFTGQFSLGHAGFMALGAYASALLYMSPSLKAMNFLFNP